MRFATALASRAQCRATGCLLAGRHVAIIMDADAQGRAGAKRIANDLADHAQIVDLAPRRTDGYDLTNWLLDNPSPAGRLAELVAERRR